MVKYVSGKPYKIKGKKEYEREREDINESSEC
jgi:hypothetical protein